MILKSQKKALSLVELLVVILIISILIVISSAQYNKYINNSKIDNVEQDLSGWMSDINQYIEDYGPFRIDANDPKLKITSKETYLAYLYYGNAEKSTSGIGENANNFESNAPLNILQSYCTNAFVIEDPEKDVVFDGASQYIILTTKSKRDPWGQKYKIICDTVQGIVIVASSGPNTASNFEEYQSGDFDDDIILVITPKR